MSLVRPVERGADHLAADAVTLAVPRVPRQARVRAVQLVAPVAELVVDGLELLVGGPRQTGSPCTARRAVRVPARCSILGRTLEAFGREVNQQEDDGWKIAGQPAHQLDGRVHRPGRSSDHTRYRDRPSAPLSRSPPRRALRSAGRAGRPDPARARFRRRSVCLAPKLLPWEPGTSTRERSPGPPVVPAPVPSPDPGHWPAAIWRGPGRSGSSSPSTAPRSAARWPGLASRPRVSSSRWLPHLSERLIRWYAQRRAGGPGPALGDPVAPAAAAPG